jgi:hypothetical protein
MRKRPSRRQQLAALVRESARAEDELIRRALARPPARRTHFLRKRIALRMSAL